MPEKSQSLSDTLDKDAYLELLRKKGKLVHVNLSEGEILETFLRASGDCICQVCERTYREHPYIDNFLHDDGTRLYPFLHRICDGMIVKL